MCDQNDFTVFIGLHSVVEAKQASQLFLFLRFFPSFHNCLICLHVQSCILRWVLHKTVFRVISNSNMFVGHKEGSMVNTHGSKNKNAVSSQRSILTQLCSDYNTDNAASQLISMKQHQLRFSYHVSEDVTVSEWRHRSVCTYQYVCQFPLAKHNPLEPPGLKFYAIFLNIAINKKKADGNKHCQDKTKCGVDSVVTVRCMLTGKPNMPCLINGLLALSVNCNEEQKTLHGNK